MTDDPSRPSGPDETPGTDGPPASDLAEAQLRHLLNEGAGGTDGDAFSTIFAVQRRVRRRRALRGGMAGCVATGLALGVGVGVLPAKSHGAYPPALGAGRSAPATRLTGALVSFNACSDYLDYVKNQALAVVGPYGLQSGPYAYGPSGLGTSGVGLAQGSAVAGGTGSLAPGSAPASPSVTPASGSFSQTNDQVAGVDEPDSVKTNGQIVVTLVGSTLRVLDLHANVIGTLQLSKDAGGGLLLDGTRAVVLSSDEVSAPGTVGFVPQFQGAAAASVYGSLPASPAAASATVVDLSDPAHPQLVRSFLFDGQVVAARLVGDEVRLVLRSDGPRISFVTPSSSGDTNSATATNRQLIATSTLADWLPAWQVQNPDGSTSARQAFSTCVSVARPQQASGLSTVTVFSLNPADSTPGPGTSVVAAGNTVYATSDHLFIAGPIGTTANPYAGARQDGCCSIVPPVRASTRIYSFATALSGPPVFESSGSVPGWLINSYAMDQSPDGLLRVASTSQTSSGTTQSQITVLGLSGDQLTALGSVGDLGSGEFIKAVRFIGDQAYVVTFKSFDPLYVVDLANPRQPALVGRLDQPGFSEFLYPLPGKRLLGVGVQITDGEPSGLVVATYDVADTTSPHLLDSSVLASGFQYVAQGYDPHAFLYWPSSDLALLAIPGQGPYGPNSGASGIAAYHIGGNGQISRGATLSHDTDPAARSVVINGQVWALTTAGVITANIDDLQASTWHAY